MITTVRAKDCTYSKRGICCVKLKVSQDDLANALGVVSRAVSSKNAIPVLSGIYLAAKNAGLILRATDLELEMDSTIPAQVSEEGAIVLPARYLTDLIRHIPFGDIEITTDDSNFTATLRWGKSHYVIHGFQPDQFPYLPEADGDTTLELKQSLLRDVLRQTVFAASHDEARPYLTGVHFVLRGNDLLAEATDGARIAFVRTPVDNRAGLELNVIIPTRSLNELGRILSDKDTDTLHLSLKANHAFFDLGGIKVATRLLDGQYPDLMRLVPQSYPSGVTLAKGNFTDACERAALIATDSGIKLSFTPSLLTITANAPEVGQVYDEIPAALQGPPVDIGFNTRYLIEGLKALSAQEFLFELSGSRNPARIRSTNGDGYVYIVLPLITY